jgi:hypothetical protein
VLDIAWPLRYEGYVEVDDIDELKCGYGVVESLFHGEQDEEKNQWKATK